MLEILDLIQGSDEWLAVRAEHYTSSDASAMMGDSPHTKRNALLKQKATRTPPVVSKAEQYIFDKGHKAEAAARPLAEAVLMEDLKPLTGRRMVDGLQLLASLDGAIDDLQIIWENKMINQSLVQDVLAGDLVPHYYWQLEQQLLVFGAQKVYFTTSDGDPADTYGTWYASVPERRAQLIAGWKQFAKDLADYQHVEVAPAPVAKSVERLPALVVNLVGAVTSSNLAAYKAATVAVISNINTTLETDQDFADAESNIKFCDAGEKELELVKSQALSQTATIDELFRTIDDLKEHLRAKRLNLERLVKARKESIRTEIVTQARAKYSEYVQKVNTWLGANYLLGGQPDFAAAIKGKRTVASLHEACDTLMARSKIDIDATADKIQANLEHLAGFPDQQFLFNDLSTLVLKSQDDFAITVRDRIAQHAAAEATKLEAQREAIRKEEAAKIQAKLDADAKREAIRLAELAQNERAAQYQREVHAFAQSEFEKAQAERAQEETTQAVQKTYDALMETIDADGVITQVAANNTVVQVVNRITERSFATANPRPRAATRAMVDVVLDTLSEPELHRVLTYLQANFAKRAA